MALKRKSMPSPNYSSRGGAGVRLIVLHTAEGARTIEELGSFFASSSSGVSSHVGIDDKAGTIGEYVKRGNKAWTAANANPYAVQAELCAFASWSPAEWDRHPAMLENAARWIAEEAGKFGLPISKLSDAQAQGSGRGVCQHENLGSWGGGHWDCGGNFPIERVLDMARGGATSEEDYMKPPQWLWDWLDWYCTTDRDPKKKPSAAPDKIPQWAWDYQVEVDHIAERNGMSAGERDWLVWYENGKHGERPDVPDTIPPHWWNDQARINSEFAPK